MQSPTSWSDWWASAKAGFRQSYREHLASTLGVPTIIAFVAMAFAGYIDDLVSALVVAAISIALGLFLHAAYQLFVAPYRCERKRADDNYRTYRETDSVRSAYKAQLDEIAKKEAAAHSEAAQRNRRLTQARRYWYDVETALTKAWHVEKRVDTEWGKLLKSRFEAFAADYFTEPAALRVQRMIREFGEASINLGPYKYADALTKTAAQLHSGLEYEDLAHPDSDYDRAWMQL